MKKRLRKLGKALEMPMGMISEYYLEVFSGNEIVLSGDAAVTELSDTVLKIKCGEHRLSFCGSNIKIEYYLSSGIKISGDFTAIEFS